MGLNVENQSGIVIDLKRWVPGDIAFEPGEEEFAGQFRTGKLKLSQWQAEQLAKALTQAVQDMRTYPFSYVYWEPEA